MNGEEEQTCSRVKKIETRKKGRANVTDDSSTSESYRYSLAAIQTPAVLGHQPAETLCVVTASFPFSIEFYYYVRAREHSRANGHATLVAFYFANSSGNDDVVQNSREVGSKI